jgi:hypothetical protein
MMRLLRILPNVATALSLVMCLAIAILWRASYSANVPIWFNHGLSPPRLLSAENGEVSYGRTISYTAGWEGLFKDDYPFRTRCTTLLAWAAAIPLGRLAFLCVRWGRAFYVHHFGPRLVRCFKCGYDLRATPDRCPECGAVPTAQAARPGGAGG